MKISYKILDPMILYLQAMICAVAADLSLRFVNGKSTCEDSPDDNDMKGPIDLDLVKCIRIAAAKDIYS